MPTTSCGFSDGAGGTNLPGWYLLAVNGPTLEVEIGFDFQFRAETVNSRPDIPAARWSALVDTGASASCIDSALATELGLPLSGRYKVAGVGGISSVDRHLAQIYIPSLNHIIYGVFSGVHLSAGGQPHQALIGRDFLKNFRMTYEGRTGEVILSNDLL